VKEEVAMAENRPRVLVIDDEPHVRDLWAEFVRMSGCDAEVAADGQEGLARFRTGYCDVVVSDFLMPGMNGRAVARAVRQADPGVAVILITGSISDWDAELLGQPGVTLLRKPINFADFRAALHDCLGRRAERSAAIGSPGSARSATMPLTP
jgi:CheY-like chemotaxis protein